MEENVSDSPKFIKEYLDISSPFRKLTEKNSSFNDNNNNNNNSELFTSSEECVKDEEEIVKSNSLSCIINSETINNNLSGSLKNDIINLKKIYEEAAKNTNTKTKPSLNEIKDLYSFMGEMNSFMNYEDEIINEDKLKIPFLDDACKNKGINSYFNRKDGKKIF